MNMKTITMEYEGLFVTCSYQTVSWSLKNILDLLDKRTGGLNLDPDYQRGDVWNNKTREQFIHTLYKGRSIPPLQIIDERDGRPRGEPISIFTYETQDGRNRIRTCQMFRDGEFSIRIPGYKRKVKWGDLDERDRQDFEEYKIPVIMSRWMSRKDRLEHFNALQNGSSLSSFEKMKNVEHPCMKLFNSLTSKYDDAISGILPNNHKRGAGVNLVANIFEICRGGHSSGTSKQIKDYVMGIPESEQVTPDGIKVGKAIRFLHDYLCVIHNITIHRSVQLAMLTDIAWVFVNGEYANGKNNLYMLQFIKDVNVYCADKSVNDNELAVKYVNTHLGTGNRERYDKPICIERRKILTKMFESAQAPP